MRVETRRSGLEVARAELYPAITQDPPCLYSSKIHPANVRGAPFVVAVTPAKSYVSLAIPDVQVTNPAESVLASLIAANMRDPQASFVAPPACR